jgi:hypothetical protein
MSTDVYLWDQAQNGGLPSSYAAAQAQFSQLDGVVRGINPKFAAFGHHLYQLISTATEPDEELLDYYKNIIDVVTESKQVEQAIYVLGLPPHNFIGAIRLIVQGAAAQGLVVMYGPPETVFLPNGQTLPPEQGAMWQAAWQHMDEEEKGEFPTTLTEFKKYTESRIAEMAARHGYVKAKHPAPFYPFHVGAKGYIKDIPFGQQFFTMSYQGGRGEFRVILNMFFFNTTYASIFKKFNFQDGEEMLYTSLPSYKGFSRIGQGPRITNVDELNAILSAIDEKILTLHDQLQTIGDIDALLNGHLNDLLQKTYMPPRAVIIARLAGNPCFEELVETINALPATAWGIDKDIFQEEWPKLREYLRNEVKPIV